MLEDAGVLIHSKRYELGIEELLKEPFLEMRGKSGLVDIYAEHFSNAIAKVQGAPVNDFGLFFKQLYAVADETGGTGVIMGLLLKSGNTFTAIFQENPKLGDEAAKLYRIFLERRDLAEKNQNVINERNARFEMVLVRVNQFLALVQGKYDAGDYQAATSYGSFLGDVRYEYEKLAATRQDVDDAFAKLNGLIDAAKGKITSMPPVGNSVSAEAIQAARDLYASFKEAYEARDDSRLMSFISDEWQAGDGSTLSDLQTNLRRSFKTFDDIKYNIQNLSVRSGQAGRYIVSYEVTITSRIFRRNLKHEEKSSINEEVVIDSTGKAKISKTLGGRFWYVE
jgi:hypothetical protein